MDEITPVKVAIGEYLTRWYNFLVPTTQSVKEFTERGVSKSILWASDRMVDAAEDMLASYRKNDMGGDPGKNAKLPIVLVAMSKDFSPVTGDWGRQQSHRTMISLAENGSVYGYRQAMMEARLQIALCATDSATARSLASQLALWVAAPANRTIPVARVWGQYTLTHPVQIENPDLAIMAMQMDQPNISMLVTDLTLKITIPYLDAPKDGEPNDGTTNNPKGYPLITEADIEAPVSAYSKILIK